VATPALPRKSVIFVSFDDMNDWVGFLGGHPQARTPNIDRLARRGVGFKHAYTPFPSCGPARMAVMTGLMPSTSGGISNSQRIKEVAPNVPTLQEFFKAQGYYTAGFGKITNFDDDFTWDLQMGQGNQPSPDGAIPVNKMYDPKNPDDRSLQEADWGPSKAGFEAMPDTQLLRGAQRFLNNRPAAPFFMALGFHAPHNPWYVPRQYFDRFPLSGIQLPAVLPNDINDLPKPFFNQTANNWHERIVKTNNWHAAVQGYLASISYADDLLGGLLATVDELKLWDQVTFVLWSDNGFHLGEKEHWTKKVLTEDATHVPMVIVSDGVTRPEGVCERPVSILDLFPTLAHLNGLTPPAGMEGRSLLPLLRDPRASFSRAAVAMELGQSAKCARSERYRYIRWRAGQEELYDHALDPHEWYNLAADPQYAAIKRELACWLPKK
jgi:arylsulfatase A-like enzyme